MTNAEKFEEVFGIKVDSCPDDPCCIADDEYCSVNGFSGLIKDKKCQDCELYHFWSKEYDKTEENREEVLKAFHLGVLFGVTATSDEVLSMVMKELNMEVKENE